MTLGERIFKYRAKNGITQAKMGELLGVGKHVIYRVENEKGCAKTRAYLLSEKMNELEK